MSHTGFFFFGRGSKQEIFTLVVRANFVGKKRKKLTKNLYHKITQLISRHLVRKTGYEAGTGIVRLLSKASNTGFSRHIKTCNLPVFITSNLPVCITRNQHIIKRGRGQPGIPLNPDISMSCNREKMKGQHDTQSEQDG